MNIQISKFENMKDAQSKIPDEMVTLFLLLPSISNQTLLFNAFSPSLFRHYHWKPSFLLPSSPISRPPTTRIWRMILLPLWKSKAFPLTTANTYSTMFSATSSRSLPSTPLQFNLLDAVLTALFGNSLLFSVFILNSPFLLLIFGVSVLLMSILIWAFFDCFFFLVNMSKCIPLLCPFSLSWWMLCYLLRFW